MQMVLQFGQAVEHIDLNSQGHQPNISQAIQGDLDLILAGAHNQVHRLVCKPLAQSLEIVSLVRMMVGECAKGDDLATQGLECVAKRGWVANAAEGRNALAS